MRCQFCGFDAETKEYQEFSVCENCLIKIKGIEKGNYRYIEFYKGEDNWMMMDDEAKKYIEEKSEEIEKTVQMIETDVIETKAKEEIERKINEQENYVKAKRAEYKKYREEQRGYDWPIYEMEGCMGRNIVLYDSYLVLTADCEKGAILPDGELDGAKVIYYKDILDLKYKKADKHIGFIQLIMNPEKNYSSTENNPQKSIYADTVFTFDSENEELTELIGFIRWKISK